MIPLVLDLVWKGLVGGAVSFIVRRSMEQGEKELEKLKELPPSFARRDKEEMLADYLDEVAETIGDANEITIQKGVRIIRSRAGVFATYLHLRIVRLTPIETSRKSSPISAAKKPQIREAAFTRIMRDNSDS